jgi:predicted nuclease with TOPRIM domain
MTDLDNHMVLPHADPEWESTDRESDLVQKVADLEAELQAMEHERDALQSRVDDLEGRADDLDTSYEVEWDENQMTLITKVTYNYKHCPSCTSKLTVLHTCPNQDCHVYEQIPSMFKNQAE